MNKRLNVLLNKLNVLLVEDEINLKQIISESINPYVKHIYEEINGLDGLETFQSHDIDLIITDINMLRMNGLRMVSEIRKFNPTIPVIFLTAYDTDENILKAIELNNSNLLIKPFDKKQLITTMMMTVGQNDSNDCNIDLLHGYKYCKKSKELTYKKKNIELTKIEKRLIELLIHNKQHTVSFEMIENYVWQEKGATAETIRSYIKKLRKKIHPELIKNIQGIGYKLDI